MQVEKKYIARVIREKLGKDVTAVYDCIYLNDKETNVTKYYVTYMRIPDGYVHYRCIIEELKTDSGKVYQTIKFLE